MARSRLPPSSPNQAIKLRGPRTKENEATDERISSVLSSSRKDSCYIRDATTDDLVNFRKVPDDIPLKVWLIAFTGAAQRFAYYGITVPWQNYLENPAGNLLVPGALGLGQSTATTVNNVFLFFGYFATVLFAIISDTWLGRHKTLLVSLITFTAGGAVLFATSLPSVMEKEHAALGGFITALILLGLGQGGATAVIFSFLADQVSENRPRVIRQGDELVVTDGKLTIQRIFNTFYWMINIAALSTLATTSLEKQTGFWAAYLLPLAFLSTSIVPFIFWNRSLTKLPAQSNVLVHTANIIITASKSGFHIGAADPSYQSTHKGRSVPWTSTFVQELRRGFRACRVLLFFIIYYLCFNQSLNNIISQANQMELSGVSNDTVQSLNAIFYIVLNPIVQFWVLPFFSRRRIPLGPIVRMTIAFALLALAMAYAAVVQELIYRTGPCFARPLACEAGLIMTNDGKTEHRPNDISVWLQTPFYFLVAASEIFGFVALNEFTYLEAPENMKALVKAFEQFTAALGAVLGIALGPVSKDPWLVILYSALAGTMVVSGVVLFAVFRKYDAQWYLYKDAEDAEGSSNTDTTTPGDPK
ncbi:hypothetical protein EKO27_g5712 [Xylaria grammica]|uniref:Major facilitator superfamily (MFS) profile domain-containing protein n=1 Tax=Xylaria grammica TaxID=363999 RepID=A0A439D4Q9_9PEZI|nr:hypothetical protein EKO27_g5712 [Xylaria grammica]